MILAAAVFALLSAATVWAGDTHNGVGVVKEVKDNKVTISHDAIPSMGMGAMSMVFQVDDPDMLQDLKPGAKIRFSFEDKKTALLLTEFESAE